jgi:hypothetical protein
MNPGCIAAILRESAHQARRRNASRLRPEGGRLVATVDFVTPPAIWSADFGSRPAPLRVPLAEVAGRSA